MVEPNDRVTERPGSAPEERDPRGMVSSQHAQGAASAPGTAPTNAGDATRAASARAQSQSPFVLMSRISDEMDRLFDGFWLSPFSRTQARTARGNGGAQERARTAALWTPDIDVYESNGEIVVRADLPGMKTKDVRVEVDGDVLTIQGERKSEREEEHDGWRHSECRYGTFFRSIPLPEGTDASGIKAEFDDGVLHVRMPAPQRRSERRSIEVSSRTEKQP